MRAVIPMLVLAAVTLPWGAAARAGEVIRIRISDLAFAPAITTAHVGDTVEWANGDFIAHTATAEGDVFDVPLAADANGRITLTKPGRIDYYCRIHPNMTGVIDVAP